MHTLFSLHLVTDARKLNTFPDSFAAMYSHDPFWATKCKQKSWKHLLGKNYLKDEIILVPSFGPFPFSCIQLKCENNA